MRERRTDRMGEAETGTKAESGERGRERASERERKKERSRQMNPLKDKASKKKKKIYLRNINEPWSQLKFGND